MWICHYLWYIFSFFYLKVVLNVKGKNSTNGIVLAGRESVTKSSSVEDSLNF